VFTGIVEELGEVREVAGGRLAVQCRTVLQDAEIGSSLAVNGVCLTVVERADDRLTFDLSEETLDRTSFRRLSVGDPVNLERPVTLATRLGGHLVQGHVDGVGTVESLDEEGTLSVRTPEELLRYLVEKGSVAVDGISLTVSALDGDCFEVALIPHTLAVTTLGRAKPGDPVNLEVDVMAKYVERLLAWRSP
jgi:riboflavin synthase